MLFFASSRFVCNWVKGQLQARYKMKDLGAAKLFIGIEIERDRPRKLITLKQTRYIEQTLQELRMAKCNGISTPLDRTAKLWSKATIEERDMNLKDYWHEKEADIKQYQSIVGKLMYAMICTRPDIAYPVSLLSRFNSAPMASHLTAAMRTIRYLRQTSNYGLTYNGNILGEPQGFSDSDYANDLQFARSTTGYVFTLNGAAISWKSRRQTTTATASEEAEYMALADTASEATWLRGLHAEIKGIRTPKPLLVRVDNTGAIRRAIDPKYHGRLKHIAVRHHFVRDVVEANKLILQHIPSKDNVADLLTKPLPRDAHEKFMEAIGVRR